MLNLEPLFRPHYIPLEKPNKSDMVVLVFELLPSVLNILFPAFTIHYQQFLIPLPLYSWMLNNNREINNHFKMLLIL